MFFPSVGGAEVCIYNLLSCLSKRGHDVTLYAPFISWIKLRNRVSFRIIPIQPKSDWWYRKYPEMGAFLTGKILEFHQARRKHEVFHVQITYPSGYIISKVLPKVPKVLTCQGVDIQKRPELDYGLRLDPVVDEKIARAVNVMDAIGAISKDIKQELMGLGVPAEKIELIPNGAPWDRFSSKPDVKELREHFNLPLDLPVIITTGRNHPKKGYHLIPGIARTVADQGLDFRWLIVGAETSKLAEEIKKLGLEEKVILRESIWISRESEGKMSLEFPDPELVKLYQSADIYAFPSLLEGLPLVLPEAMAAGLAIVTTNAPGCDDVIEDGVTGLIAKAGAAGDFAEKLIKLLKNPDFGRKLGDSAATRKELYDWDALAGRYEKLFGKVIAEKRK